MGASRRTSLLVSGAVCGALVLGAAGYTATAGTASSAPGSSRTSAPAQVPPPSALRKAAGQGMRAIDENVIGKEAAEAAAAECGAAREAGRAPSERCTVLQENLGTLGKARAGLERQAGSAQPDLAALTASTTDAVAATARLAREQDREHGGHDRHRDGGGLLGVVGGLVGGLVDTLGGVVQGLNGLVNGLLRALLS
ncbi:hypothetical protein [Streptomyces cinnamoneus]|uniref:Uncharacterized protein n=1 Tax=Streptomyces cinnamoneus TaxID=53446 RepID=A0A918TYQ2_STRCJ|nr:hypothetical protein [Streptomyces cinnamoneus]GHC68076.1 hypothetical protein GCM10010507_53010 [Streptomyces cinnamoneus]